MVLISRRLYVTHIATLKGTMVIGLEPDAGDTGTVALGKSAMWTPSAESYSWKSIESAPLVNDVTLQVTDGRGGPYTLRWPCRRTASGWINSGKGTQLARGHAGEVEAVRRPAVSPLMTFRRFPPPWRAEPIPGGYIVRDANGQALACLYSRDNPIKALQAKMLTKGGARRFPVNIARLPKLLGRLNQTESSICPDRGRRDKVGPSGGAMGRGGTMGRPRTRYAEISNRRDQGTESAA
jgi:hypothetical protein